MFFDGANLSVKHELTILFYCYLYWTSSSFFALGFSLNETFDIERYTFLGCSRLRDNNTNRVLALFGLVIVVLVSSQGYFSKAILLFK